MGIFHTILDSVHERIECADFPGSKRPVVDLKFYLKLIGSVLMSIDCVYGFWFVLRDDF